MREVLGVAVMVQREAVVGDDDAVAPVEDPAHDQPLARHELMRSVDVRVAEVRGAGMVGEHRLLACARSGSPSRRRRDASTVGACSSTGTGSPGGSNSHGFIQPWYAGTPPTETNWSTLPAVSSAIRRSRPYIAMTTSNVDRRAAEQLAQRIVVVGIAMDVRDLSRRLGPFVQPAMHDRDVVAPGDESPYQRDPGRSRPADHQGTRHGAARYPSAPTGHENALPMRSSSARVDSSHRAPRTPA